MYLSLKYRIAVIIFALETLMMGVVLSQTLGHSLESSYKQLAANEEALLGVVSGVSRIALLTEEYADLQPYLQEVMEDPRVVRLLLADDTGRVVASTALGNIGLPISPLKDTEDRFWRHRVIGNISGQIGVLAMEFSKEGLIKANAESRKLGIGIAFASMLIIAIVGVLVGYLLTRRLEIVTTTSVRLAQGDLRARTDLSGADEFGLLGTSFDNMAESIQQHTKELEDRVKARTAQLNLAKQEAEHANQIKSEFLSNMSHELRTPLNAILGFSQILNMDNLSNEQNENVNEILTAGYHLLGLINDILHLTKIESGKMKLQIKPIELLTLCKQCSSQVEAMAKAKMISVDFETSGCENVLVMADPTRLKQVILNLLSNAVKYNQDKGSVLITCKRLESETLKISVIDTGIGIPQEELGNVFEAFNRLGAENSGIQGTGIGLSISKNLIERMDGKIGVESIVGEGSEFWFELPISSKQKPEDTHTEN